MIVKTLTPNYLSLRTPKSFLFAVAKVFSLFGNGGFGIVSCAPFALIHSRVSEPGHQGGATCHLNTRYRWTHVNQTWQADVPSVVHLTYQAWVGDLEVADAEECKMHVPEEIKLCYMGSSGFVSF